MRRAEKAECLGRSSENVRYEKASTEFLNAQIKITNTNKQINKQASKVINMRHELHV